MQTTKRKRKVPESFPRVSDVYYCLSLNTKHKRKGKLVSKRFLEDIAKYFPSKQPDNESFALLTSILTDAFSRFINIKKRSYARPPPIKKLLNHIIPKTYFGCTANRKIFYRVVDRILTQSQYECIHDVVLYENYIFDYIPWLQTGDELIRRKCLLETNIFLLENVVKPLVKFFYKPVLDYKSYRIRMISRRHDWASFQFRILDKLIKSDHLRLVPKQDARKYKPTGFLKLLPKSTLESLAYRPIITLLDKSTYGDLKRRLDTLISQIRTSSELPKNNDLFAKWVSYAEEVQEKKIYGIKLDLQDAFGNVNIQTLCDTILETDSKHFPPNEKLFLIQKLENQYVYFGNNLYEWRHGLLQGDRLSTRLCNLYLTLLEVRLKPYLRSGCFYHRTVDDIFFCSTNVGDIINFETDVKKLHTVNESKTARYLHSDDNENISYVGKIFNLRTKEVKNLYSYERGTEIRNRFKFWDTQNQFSSRKVLKFIERSLQFFNSRARFSKFEFNTKFNSPETVLENTFESMCYLAFKLDAAITSVDYALVDKRYFLSTVIRSIRYIIENHCPKIRFYTRVYRGSKEKQDTITMTLLKLISYKAFLVVFQRRLSFYRHVIRLIKTKEIPGKKLKLKGLDINPKKFHVLPECFRNIVTRKKPKI